MDRDKSSYPTLHRPLLHFQEGNKTKGGYIMSVTTAVEQWSVIDVKFDPNKYMLWNKFQGKL